MIPILHPIWKLAADQTPPTSGAHVCMAITSLIQLATGRPSMTADDAARGQLGLTHVRPCSAGGSRADLLVDPSTGGGVRVGYDLPARFEVPTLGRFGKGSRLGSGIT